MRTLKLDQRAEAELERVASVSRRQQALLAAAGFGAVEARWHVLTVADGREKAVDKLLCDAGVDTLLPLETIEQRRRGRHAMKAAEPVSVPYFRGYLFVRVPSTAYVWSWMATVKHVTGVIGGWEHAMPVSDMKIRELRAFLALPQKERLQAVKQIAVGQKVRLLEGAFTDWDGIVLEMSGAQVRVGLWLFGREVQAQTDLALVRRID